MTVYSGKWAFKLSKAIEKKQNKWSNAVYIVLD